MADLAKAVKDAVHARLNGSVGATVYDIPPGGAVVPVVLIDGVAADPAQDKAGGLKLMSVSLVAFTQERNRDGLRTIVTAILDRLSGYKPAAGAVVLGDFMAGETSEETLSDGLTHVGRLRFSVYAQSA